jgi:hypothetical protein
VITKDPAHKNKIVNVLKEEFFVRVIALAKDFASISFQDASANQLVNATK